MNRKTERYREKFYAISKIDITDIVGTVIIKTYNKDYIQLERTINYSTEEQLDQLTISITEEKRTLTITVAYPELPINKIGTFVRHNFYFGTSVITPTDAYPEVIHTLWLPKEQTIEQNIIDIRTLAAASSPTHTTKY